jgi:agmatine/peptidylarginine deiminase
MITDNLTNAVYFSGLLPEKCPVLNAHITEAIQQHGVSYAYLSGTKDIWCRDFMPLQIEENRFVFYKYTPNYLQDKKWLRFQTDPIAVLQIETNKLQSYLDKSIAMDLIVDGGNVVKCGDTIVMTEKVFVENKDKTRSEVERILREAFQCDILFLPWDKEEIFGHSDGIVHYAGNNKVLLTNYDDFSLYYYNRFRKVLEKRFEVIPLMYHAKRKHARSWAYINFLQVGNLILVPQLGLEEDKQAFEQIGNALPDCEVVGVPSHEAVRCGGALNCISWNIKN